MSLLEKLKTYDSKGASDGQLRNDHKYLHEVWDKMVAENLSKHGGRNREDIWNIHKMIIAEMKTRKLK
ncbi:unnamed protein product, partial [marine sediment metagenome]